MTAIPTNILDCAKEANNSLLPKISHERYNNTYKQFCAWRLLNKADGINETLILAYFYEKVTFLIQYD